MRNDNAEAVTRMSELVGALSPINHKGLLLSGLREPFIRRYIVERTSKAEIRPEEQNGKAENGRENLWNEMQLKGPYTQEETQD